MARNRSVTTDHPRTPWELHRADCSCCGEDPAALDWNGVAVRFLLGLGWDALLIFVADALGLVSGGSVL